MPGESSPQVLIIYADEQDHEPFTDWLRGLKDRQGRKRIESRLLRLEQGNFGDCQSVGNGVSELRMFFGPGYRVYFGQDGNTIVVLLCGGDKSTQQRDIQAAKEYWRDYLDNA